MESEPKRPRTAEDARWDPQPGDVWDGDADTGLRLTVVRRDGARVEIRRWMTLDEWTDGDDGGSWAPGDDSVPGKPDNRAVVVSAVLPCPCGRGKRWVGGTDADPRPWCDACGAGQTYREDDSVLAEFVPPADPALLATENRALTVRVAELEAEVQRCHDKLHHMQDNLREMGTERDAARDQVLALESEIERITGTGMGVVAALIGWNGPLDAPEVLIAAAEGPVALARRIRAERDIVFASKGASHGD